MTHLFILQKFYVNRFNLNRKMTEDDEWIAIKEFKIGPPSDKKDKIMIIVSINEFENKVFLFAF